MKFKAEIDVMPLESLLDPQGKAVSHLMPKVGLNDISNVRIGKHVTMMVEASSKEEAETQVTQSCKKVLANEIMESFTFTLSEI
jgi:phosphoribosylformylglycinamidine synthase subunit PurS